MSILYESDLGFFISHEKIIESIYRNVLNEQNECSFRLQKSLFKIVLPYIKISEKRKRKRNLKRKLESDELEELRKEVFNVKSLYTEFRTELLTAGLLQEESNLCTKNTEALETAENIYAISGKPEIINNIGLNNGNAICRSLKNEKYLFPADSKFYCKNITEIGQYLHNEKYDLIVVDPPWWNKYIRRKKLKTNNAYNMIYNEELKAVPIEKLIKDEGIVAVWCTNSSQHVEALKGELFKKWNITFWGKWYWLKVTLSGIPICNFAHPPSKQPFEQIIFGCRTPHILQNLTYGKLLVSVPSALHSHKPPLIDVLRKYLPKDPKCLEIFARYLLPNWTSYGLESIRFQHSSLYEMVEKSST